MIFYFFNYFLLQTRSVTVLFITILNPIPTVVLLACCEVGDYCLVNDFSNIFEEPVLINKNRQKKKKKIAQMTPST